MREYSYPPNPGESWPNQHEAGSEKNLETMVEDVRSRAADAMEAAQAFNDRATPETLSFRDFDGLDAEFGRLQLAVDAARGRLEGSENEQGRRTRLIVTMIGNTTNRILIDMNAMLEAKHKKGMDHFDSDTIEQFKTQLSHAIQSLDRKREILTE